MAEKVKKILKDQGNTIRIPYRDGSMELTFEQINAIICSIHEIVKFYFAEQQREEAQKKQEALE